MTLDDYQIAARQTLMVAKEDELNHAIVGLLGEAGELANKYKKNLYFNGDYDLSDELGDVLWFVAETASALGLSLDDLARQNLDKVRRKYAHTAHAARAVES